MPIKILLVDPHAITRLGIIQIFNNRDDITVVGEAATIEEGILLARETSPDVAIIDPNSGEPDALSLLAELHTEMPELRTLVFTAVDGPEIAEQVVALGASGYLVKVACLDEVAVAIRCIYEGRVFISHSHSPITPKANALKSAKGQQLATNASSLSEREREVLEMLADGMTNKQVAAKLFLSVKTVETYRARIMKKYNLTDRVGLVQFARELMSDRLSA